MIPELAPQAGSASPADEGSAEEIPPEAVDPTQHNASTGQSSEPLPSVVPTVQGKRSREGDADAGLQNKTKKRRKKSGQQSK